MGLTVLVLIGVAGLAVILYNRLIRLRQLGDNAWADIDVQLKRRHDLIPRLVEVVKGHAGYERGTLESVVAARSRALNASGPADRGRAERPVEQGVHRILAIAEDYPDLQAQSAFLELQRALTEVEDHLQQARRYYNAVVRDYNTQLAQFPGNLVAGRLFGFTPREYFELDDAGERAVPVVDTGGGS